MAFSGAKLNKWQRRWMCCLMVMLLALPSMLRAQQNRGDSAAADTMAAVNADSLKLAQEAASDSFVTASLLTLAPTSEIYSVFGHVALRMECPSKGLDYVFTYETDNATSGFLTFFAGKADAGFVAVETKQFLSDVSKTGRGVRQYQLNLLPREKQELWRQLDQDMVDRSTNRFDLEHHCVSTMLMKLHTCLDGEYLEWGPWDGEMALINGELLRYQTRRNPWAEWLFITFLGNHYGDKADEELLLAPSSVISYLSKARFVDVETNQSRPALKGQAQELLPDRQTIQNSIMTPNLVLGLFFIFVVLFTLAQRLWGWRRLGLAFDLTLLTLQTLAGCALLYIAVASTILSGAFNWYLIPCCPLALPLLAIAWRKGKTQQMLTAFTLVLIAFLALTPFVGQIDWSHQWITAMLAVRSGIHVLYVRQRVNFKMFYFNSI